MQRIVAGKLARPRPLRETDFDRCEVTGPDVPSAACQIEQVDRDL